MEGNEEGDLSDLLSVCYRLLMIADSLRIFVQGYEVKIASRLNSNRVTPISGCLKSLNITVLARGQSLRIKIGKNTNCQATSSKNLSK